VYTECFSVSKTRLFVELYIVFHDRQCIRSVAVLPRARLFVELHTVFHDRQCMQSVAVIQCCSVATSNSVG
jgi:hypothetical protein